LGTLRDDVMFEGTNDVHHFSCRHCFMSTLKIERGRGIPQLQLLYCTGGLNSQHGMMKRRFGSVPSLEEKRSFCFEENNERRKVQKMIVTKRTKNEPDIFNDNKKFKLTIFSNAFYKKKHLEALCVI
jgi:hypothetical protein